METSLKDAVKRLAVTAGPARVARRFRRHRTLVLAYHNVVPNGAGVAGETALHLPRDVFAEQLDILVRTHEIVPLRRALEPRRPSGSRPQAVLTFDDGYRGAVTVGIAEVVRRGLPATIFVAPDFVGDGTFWWDIVKLPGGIDAWERFRERALTDLEGRDDEIRARAREAGYGERDVPAHQRCASLEELEAAVAHPGITVASHSWGHPNLTLLAGDELRRQLERPVSWLERHFPGATVPCIAYPYGRSSREVERRSREAGYEGGFRLADTCWLPEEPDSMYSLPRFSIPRGMSRWDFGLRVSGIRA